MDVLILEAAYQYLCNHNLHHHYLDKQQFCKDMYNVRVFNTDDNAWLIVYKEYDSRFDYENRAISVEYNKRHDIFTVTEVMKTEVYTPEDL